ncbi:ATPase [Halalkalirubrum salinum]|uniref:ATPase n=1 Tax=Halalkalirubrum salinum TaxID=2563889 RepID=UPI0010FAF3AD|nr:ATPase [Halalkalirubrum salinum]
MKLLVAGGAPVDAGKTTFSVGLLGSIDGAIGFKPRAGNDYWFDHDDVCRAIDDGRLYGKDVHRLAAGCDRPGEEERLNPVHRLWRPTPGRRGMLGEEGRTFLVDRVRTVDGDRFVVNANAIDADLLPAAVRDSLPLEDAVRVQTIPAFNEIMVDLYVPAFDRIESEIAATDPVVVESYGDIAAPVSAVSFDAVAVVEPSRVRVYDGERYAKAREIASGSARAGQLEERVERVVDLLDPQATHELPALTSDDRADPSAIAASYAEAYRSLLDVAFA